MVRTGRNQDKLIGIPRDTAQRVPTRFPSILRYPPDCVFQQDGASPHAAAVVQEFCAEKPPTFWKKEDWPATSPDLNLIDYYVWGHVQSLVDKRNLMRLDPLKLAIRQSVDSIPLDMLQRAIMGFSKRVKKCIQEEGGVFKDRDLRAVAEAAVSVDSQSGAEEEAAASSGAIEWL